MKERTLMVLEYFPTEKAGIILPRPLTEDVQDTRDKMKAQLLDASHRYTQSGWVADHEIEYVVVESGKGILARLHLTLED